MKDQISSITFRHDAQILSDAILVNGKPILKTGFPPDIFAPKHIVAEFEGKPLEDALEMIGDNYVLGFFVGKVVSVTDRKFREKVCLALARNNKISKAIERVWRYYLNLSSPPMWDVNPVVLLYAVTMACHRFSALPHEFQVFMAYSVDIPNLN